MTDSIAVTPQNQISEEIGFAKFADWPKPKWDMAPTGNFEVTFRITTAPNWFHRAMQRLILGIKYRRIT